MDLPPVAEAVRKVKAECSEYIAKLEQNYLLREAWRDSQDILVISFNGYGRAGKDTAARYLGGLVPHINYVGSISSIVAPLICQSMGESEEDCFRKRHTNRKYWFDWCNEFRREDPSQLCRFALSVADVTCGIRSDVELYDCMRSQVVDLSIWVDNPRVAIDKTTEYGPEDCDIAIHNVGGRNELYRKVERLCHMLGLNDKPVVSFEDFKEKISDGEEKNKEKVSDETSRSENASQKGPRQKTATEAQA